MSRGGVLLVFCGLVSSCGDDISPVAPQDSETKIAIVSGDDQLAVANDTLPAPLVVVVTDSDDQPMAGRKVEFAVVRGEGELVVQRLTTNNSGLASTAIVPFGAVCISDTSLAVVQVEARVEGTEEVVLFTASMATEELPRVLRRVSPHYPELARKAGVEADVTVTILVDETGADADIREITGPEVFHDAVSEAIAQWTFSPATQNCIPQQVLVSVPFSFRLNGASESSKLHASSRFVWSGSVFVLAQPVVVRLDLE